MAALAGHFHHHTPRAVSPASGLAVKPTTPKSGDRPRHVRFSSSLASNELTRADDQNLLHAVSGEPHRRSVPNIHGASPPTRKTFAQIAKGTRRASMFGRNFNLSTTNVKPVTCIPPIVKFRRGARIVRLLCTVCLACKKSLSYSVSQNSWVALKEALLRESDVSKEQEKEKKGLNTEDPELTFDLSKFKKMSKDHDEMPLKIKELLRKKVQERTIEENANIMRSMQKLEVFARYPLSVQKRLCAKAWLEDFDANRVILRGGHNPSCFYFIISGRLVSNEEEDQGHTVTTLLKRGDKFGEEELALGDKRKATVMSQDNVELFVIHIDDYREICLRKGDKDFHNLQICKKNPVFNHWPIKKLIDNPASWTMQNYKSGSLIVEDSSRTEWVYVIKSGQCKVLKCMKPREPEEDPAQVKRFLAKQARDKLIKEIESNNVQTASKIYGDDDDGSRLAPSSTFFTTPLSRPQTFDNPDPTVQAALREANRIQTAPNTANYPFLSSLYGTGLDEVAYVALETLSAGDSFGFLAVLPKEQRGTSVSLISCGAEVIQINKKFFQKFADETVYSLINMKFPPFPKQHDILKNLKQSFDWKDYKRRTTEDALGHLFRTQSKP